jgi:hypothetical protein
VSTAGAYFGEVLRRRHPSHWFLGDDPSAYRIELEVARLVVHPMSSSASASPSGRPRTKVSSRRLVLSLEDRDALAKRLEELPEVTDEELFAPSTRLEVIDIALDLLHGRRLGMN